VEGAADRNSDMVVGATDGGNEEKDILIGDRNEVEQALLLGLPEGQSKKTYWRLSSISGGFSSVSDDTM
jgi:hypothetical protein